VEYLGNGFCKNQKIKMKNKNVEVVVLDSLNGIELSIHTHKNARCAIVVSNVFNIFKL
jgi:hypothetical protein